MGISGFFNELNKEYDITKVINKDKRIDCKYLILDFNAIIHNISQINYHRNNGKQWKLFQESISQIIEYKEV